MDSQEADVSSFDVDLLPKLRQPERPGRAKSGFLTSLDRATLDMGPIYRQTTRREYRGERIDRERRAYEMRYAKARSKALRALPGVMEDLLFLVSRLDPEALYAALLMPTRTGNEPALPLVLEALAMQVGMERMPQQRRGEVVRGGPFVVVALLGAMERGLNVADQGSGQRHTLGHTLRVEAPREPLRLPRARQGTMSNPPKPPKPKHDPRKVDPMWERPAPPARAAKRRK